jgi:hypothetical protein
VSSRRESSVWSGSGISQDRAWVSGKWRFHRISGIWNSNHVYEDYDPAFLRELDRVVAAMERRS